MARMSTTARKKVSSRLVTIGRSDKFYSFKMGNRRDMERFLDQFLQIWASARECGVTELDGLLQLVQALPFKWKVWALVAALDFVHPDMEVQVTGNLSGFIDLIKEQFRLFGHPPLGSYPPLDHLIPSVHQILDDLLTSKKRDIEPKQRKSTDEITSNPENPNDCYYEFQYCTGLGMTSIDLDLYGQPFALSSPSLPFLLLNPPSETTLASTSANVDNEIEMQPSVGTSSLQPLPISDMSFYNGPHIPDSRVSGHSDASHSHPQEESDSETPEGYRDIDNY